MGKYLDISEIEALQIDITSKCNLLCPQCARVDKGHVNSCLPITELIPEDYDKIFTEEICRQLKKVFLNGNYGDPVASRHIEYVIDKLLEQDISITVFTNGSLKNTSWWENLGDKFSNTASQVVFSIDGLKDTNAIYRINSCFNKIMENVKSYIQAGGRARWDFLVFEHNYHQVEEAKKLARNLGFKQFQEKKTTRFLSKDTMGEAPKNSQEVYNKEAKVIYEIKAMSGSDQPFENILHKYGSWEKYLDSTSIHCKYKNDMKALFIDFEAMVWPCCWIGVTPYLVDQNDIKKKQLDNLRERHGNDFNSLRYHSLKEILSHPWFASELVESWDNSTSTTTNINPRLMVCARTCASEYGFTSMPGSKHSTMYNLNQFKKIQ